MANGVPVYLIDPQTMAMNFTIKVQVVNGNGNGVTIDEISGTGMYRVSDTDLRMVATGTLKNITITAKETTMLMFPVTAVYGEATDPGKVALKGLVTSCGLVDPSKKSKVPMEFKVNVKTKIANVAMNVNFTQAADLDCPLPPGTNNPILTKVVQELQANGTSPVPAPNPASGAPKRRR